MKKSDKQYPQKIAKEGKTDNILKEVKIDNEGLVVILPRANLKEFEHS